LKKRVDSLFNILPHGKTSCEIFFREHLFLNEWNEGHDASAFDCA